MAGIPFREFPVLPSSFSITAEDRELEVVNILTAEVKEAWNTVNVGMLECTEYVTVIIIKHQELFDDTFHRIAMGFLAL